MNLVGNIKHREEGNSLRVEHVCPPEADHIHRFFLNCGRESVSTVGTVPHISLCTRENLLDVQGMFVPDSERGGCGVSDALMLIAKQVSDAVGRPIQRTAKLRKPLMAMFMQKWGFSPRSESTISEILPKVEGETTPRVRISTKKDNVDPSYEGWFVRERGKVNVNSGNRIVPLFCHYDLTDPVLFEERAGDTHDKMNGLLRIFPRRIQRLIE